MQDKEAEVGAKEEQKAGTRRRSMSRRVGFEENADDVLGEVCPSSENVPV